MKGSLALLLLLILSSCSERVSKTSPKIKIPSTDDDVILSKEEYVEVTFLIQKPLSPLERNDIYVEPIIENFKKLKFLEAGSSYNKDGSAKETFIVFSLPKVDFKSSLKSVIEFIKSKGVTDASKATYYNEGEKVTIIIGSE